FIQCTCRIANRIFSMLPSPPYISISLFSYFLIISGSVTMSLGFLGCLGSLKTVKCLLATYFILLTVLLAAQIVVPPSLLTLTGTLRKDWEESIPCSCYNIGNATVNATYEIQDPNKCNTCFPDDILSNHTCGVYKQGCSENIKEWLDENLLMILVVILAISVVEVSKLSL
uniref:CD37 molecule n=1 Tax=Sinocyclocheilus anshuiensis TaxID=1608454 RepID=A0A671PUW8_9TELE